MKKRKISFLDIAMIVIFIAILIFLFYPKPSPPITTEEIAKCIGENSILYTQLGCSHCEDQKDLFGENVQFLKEIDCFYTPEECSGITGTPTWKIKGKLISGVQSIERLQELTQC